MRSGETSFRADIEGLRGIAVLLVVLYHAGVPGMSGGFTGVDVFFVLSGYLITELLVKEVQRTGRVNFVNFYARRARRLLPAAVLVLAVTLVASALVFAPVARLRFVKSAIATALYISNFQFLRETADYFGDNISSDPFLHTWSLAVEEQFYFVWPLLVALGLGARASRGRLATVVGAVAVASFGACVWYTWHAKSTAFFASPPRAWEFGLGGLAALLPAAVLGHRPAVARALGWIGLSLVMIAGCTVTGSMLFPGPLAMVPVLGTVAALVAGAASSGEGVGRVLAVGPLQWLGRLSYSWYLWHWPVLVIAAEAIPGLSLAGRLLAAVGALGLAAATYVAVEHPVRKHAYLLPRPWLSLKLAGGLSVAALVMALGARQHAEATAATPHHQAITAAAADRSALYRTECLWVKPDEAPRECVFGDTLSSTVVVLLGDSHAAHWFPAVQRMADEHRWRLVAILKPGCPPADVPVYDLLAGRQTENCRTWRRHAVARVAAIRPTAVILAGSIGYVDRPTHAKYGKLSLAEWEAGTRRTLQTLDAAGVRTILLRDSPRPSIDVPACLSRAAFRGLGEGACRLPLGTVVDSEVYQAELRASRALRRVAVVDFTDLFCGPAECEPVRQGMIVYRDDNHLTATYARSLGPAMAHRLTPLMSPAVQ